MNEFILPTGRRVNKPAAFGVATKSRGRWSCKFYKSHQAARKNYQQTRSWLANIDMAAYYDLQDVKFLRPSV